MTVARPAAEVLSGHAALERINSPLDRAYHFERHFAPGKAKMKTRVGLAVCVMMALVAAEAGTRTGCARW